MYMLGMYKSRILHVSSSTVSDILNWEEEAAQDAGNERDEYNNKRIFKKA